MGSMPIITLKGFREMINSKSLDKYEDLPVVASGDDEGNSYDRVLFAPSHMKDIDVNNDFEAFFKACICIN